MLTLERREFRQWLVDNPDALFTPAEYCECPLARYFNAQNPGLKAYVSPFTAKLFDDLGYGSSSIEQLELPMWARVFISRVDKWSDGDVGEISGAQALNALDGRSGGTQALGKLDEGYEDEEENEWEIA